MPGLFGPARAFAGHLEWKLRVDSLGCGSVGLQSANFAGPGLAAGLLGAHRIRLWAVLHLAQALGRCANCVARTDDYFSRNVGPSLDSYPVKGPWCTGIRMVAAAIGECRLSETDLLESS